MLLGLPVRSLEITGTLAQDSRRQASMAGLEPTPSTTMHHDAVSEVDSARAEHVVTVSSILGSGGNDSTVIASNLASESREQSRPKNAEDATKLDVIAAPDSREQVSQLCKYVLAYLITSINVLHILRIFSVLSHWIMQTNSLDNIPSGGSSKLQADS
jgi:hypothetical protein